MLYYKHHVGDETEFKHQKAISSAAEHGVVDLLASYNYIVKVTLS